MNAAEDPDHESDDVLSNAEGLDLGLIRRNGVEKETGEAATDQKIVIVIGVETEVWKELEVEN